jgi:hypothetical protein
MLFCRGVKLGISSERTQLRVFENRLLRTICGAKRDKVTGGFSKLYNEQLDEMRNAYKILVRKPKERDDLEDLGVDGSIILGQV